MNEYLYRGLPGVVTLVLAIYVNRTPQLSRAKELVVSERSSIRPTF